MAAYFFVQTTLDLLIKNTRLQILGRICSPIQLFAVPGILLLFLNLYHSPTSAAQLGSVLTYVPSAWEAILKTLTPLFELLEGISTLLVVQALGQVSRYLIEERNEGFQFLFLITSAL